MLYWLVYLGLIVGVILIVCSIFAFGNKAEETDTGFDMEGAIRAMDKSIDEADNTAAELVKISQDMVTEIDDKYQQLLYLYNLIDEKQSKLGIGKVNAVIEPAALPPKVNSGEYRNKAKSKGINPDLVNDKYKSVFELHAKGKSVPDIARSLNIGQGEVMLVLELGKER